MKKPEAPPNRLSGYTNTKGDGFLLCMFCALILAVPIALMLRAISPKPAQVESSQYKVSTEFKDYVLKNCTNNPCTMTLDDVKYDLQLSNQEVK